MTEAGVLTGTLGYFLLKVKMKAGKQGQSSVFARGLGDQENVVICQANRTINGRENQESVARQTAD
jgi:hypothetical protein